MKLRTALLAACAFATLALVGTLAVMPSGTGKVRIVNGAGERVAYGKLEICAQQIMFENLEPGEDRLFEYKITGDSHYVINVKFQSGAMLDRQLGYVTNGFDSDDVLIIQRLDFKLSQVWR
jgi:hypothetical protein